MSLPNTVTTLPRPLRTLVRSAIGAHTGWHAYRNTIGGETLADLDRAQLIAACDALQIDIAEIAARNAMSEPTEPTETETTESPIMTPLQDETPSAFEGQDATRLLDEALAGVSDWLSSKALAALASNLAPIAQAAAKGPRILERVVREQVTVDETGAIIVPPAPAVTLLETKDARDVFVALKSKARDKTGATGSLKIPVCSGIAGQGDVPSHDKNYAWDADVLGYLCLIASQAASNDMYRRNRASCLLFGPAGTGKTSAVECFAAATGRPFFRIAIDRTTEPLELVGQRLPAATGGTVFHAGAFLAAMQTPYAVILIDEPSFLRPGSAAVMQTLLDKRFINLKEDNNRRVEAAVGVMFVAADNTNLTGDETGRYADTIAQNLALVDRFQYAVPCKYMDAEIEARTLSAQTGLALTACEKMVDYANRTRNGADNQQLTTGASYRRLQAWADAVSCGLRSKQAFETSIYNSSDAQDRETIRQLERADAGMHDAIDREAGGLASSAPIHGATVTAQGARAANVFSEIDGDEIK